MASRRNAIALLRHYRQELMTYRNVVAVAIGRKRADNEVDERSWCIRVHVTRKTQRRSKHSVPRSLPAPRGRASLGTIDVDVVQTGGTVLHTLVRPSFKLKVGENGVVGCLLRDANDLAYVLTAGHVVKRSLVIDTQSNGGLPFGMQPNAFVVLPFQRAKEFVGPCVRVSGPQPIDLALVLLTAGKASPIPRISGVRDVRTSKQPLQKGELIRVLRARGNFTVLYHKEADADGSVGFSYPKPRGNGSERVVYHDIVFYPRSGNGGRLQPGDSGSPVVDGQNRLIGIHIGASQTKAPGDKLLLGYAIGCHAIMQWAAGMTVMTPDGSVSL